MKKQFFKRLLCTILALFVISTPIASFASEIEPDNFMETQSFKTSVEVFENNTYRVTETIDVNFLTDRHGIYRYIPRTYTITRNVNSKTEQFSGRVKITDISVSGDMYETYIENDCTVIQIGDGDEYVRGNKRYTISYTIKNHDDKNTEFDEFYLNALPHGWRTSIDKAEIKIKFNKPADLSGFKIYSGLYGQSDTDTFDIKTEGNTVVATSKRRLRLSEGASAYLKLDDDYFTGEEQNPALSVAMIALIILPFAAVLLLKLLLGRRKQIIPIVNFYPPNGLTSADVGYVLDGMTDTKDIISLIIYWADKGLISLQKEDKKVMRITKLANLDKTAKSYERMMFRKLFEERNTVTTKELSESFYTTISETKVEIAKYYTQIKATRIFSTASRVAAVLAVILSAVPMFSLLICGYDLKIVSEGIIVGAILCTILLAVGLVLLNYSKSKKNALSKGGFTAILIVAWILTVLATCVEALLATVILKMPILAISAAAVTLICAYVSSTIRKYTQYGRKLIGDILGFKEFIRVSELDRLKMLVEENPQYFYNVLPFAYVMGLSDKWAEKFETIAVPPPSWYNGGDMKNFNTYLFINSFNDNIDTIKSNMISVPKQSGSGSSSSFGGGFSGGGIGGGGGGSW